MPRPLSSSVDVHVSVEETFSALTGPAWPESLDAALHDGSRLVSVAPSPDGGTVVVLSRRLPEGIPGPLRRFAPADGRVTQTETWGPASGGSRRGTWSVTFPGIPGEIGGEHVLEPAGERTCCWRVTGSVRVRVPVLGGQVEGFLAPLVEKLIDRQGEVLRSHLG